MSDEHGFSSRSALKSAAAVWIGGEAGGNTVPTAPGPPPQASDLRRQIFAKVWSTPLIDTHEHLCEEQDCLTSGEVKADDWSVVLSHYFDSDLLTAGMPAEVHKRFFAKGPSPLEKWKLLAPFWPAVKNTGYGQAVRIAMRQLYGIEELSADTVEKVQAGYENTRKRGFELVEERWLSLDDALELVNPIMHDNARRIFRLAEKEKALQNAPWL
jgi:hypothetical protein